MFSNTKKQSDLTIVIPCYNQPKDLHNALSDVIQQKGLSLEVIVVDDASDMDYTTLVESFQKQGLNVQLVRQKERAYTLQARLRGMQLATGKYLAFMDADDNLCAADAYAQVVSEAKKHAADIAHFVTLRSLTYAPTEPYEYAAPFSTILDGEDIFYHWLQEKGRASVVWNKVYSQELYTKVCGISHTIKILRVEDAYLNILFLFFAKKYIPLNTTVYCYNAYSIQHLEKVMARLLDYTRMYLAIPQKLLYLGLDSNYTEKLYAYFRYQLTMETGIFLRRLKKDYPNAPAHTLPQDILKKFHAFGTVQEIFALFSIVNASNALKLQQVSSLLK